MKMHPRRWSFIFCILGVMMALRAADAAAAAINQPYLEGFTLKPVVDNYLVHGDKGRFRQDQSVPDGVSGGIEAMNLKGKADGISYEYEGRYLLNYDYLSALKVKKEDNFSAQVSWKQFRQYWDDRVTPWNPQVYGLPGDFTNLDDSKLYTDRSNVDVEISRPLGSSAKTIYEYHLWQRRGHEVLLSGGFARATGLRDLGVIPTNNRVNGVSNTFVVRVPMVINGIHHIEPSLSAEIYNDDQERKNLSFNNGVADDDNSKFVDSNQFIDIKSKVNYEKWSKDNVYVHAGFENNFLKNNSARSDIHVTDPNFFIEPRVNNWRLSNAVTGGSTILDFLQAKKLDLRLGGRAEHAITRSHSTGIADGATRIADSSLREGWFGELLSLTYKGIPKTTAFARLDMEQRRLKLQETFDARSLELFTNFGLTDTFPHDKTDITSLYFMPDFRVIRRLNSWSKASASYRFKYRFFDYNTKVNTSPGFFDYMGDRYEYINEVMTKLDLRVSKTWLSSFSYQMRLDNRSSDHGGNKDTQDIDRYRFLATLSGPASERLYLIFSGMYEYNRVDTPTFGPGSNQWGSGSKPFNFIGDVYLFSCNANYRIAKNINSTLGYQVTSSLGNNRNLFNKVAAGLEYDINPSTSVELKYAFLNFLDKRSANGVDGDFDNYSANGVSFAFKKKFF